jgi:anti-sigma factor RsiW
MQPCPNHRQSITELALGCLDPQEAVRLREHLETCQRCRGYLSEMTGLTSALQATVPEVAPQPSASFHQRLVARVKTEGPSRTSVNLRAALIASLCNWRVALPVAAGVAAIMAVLIIPQRQPSTVPGEAHAPPLISATVPETDLRPTFANYQRVMCRSLESFDVLLTEQGRQNLPSVPNFVEAE